MEKNDLLNAYFTRALSPSEQLYLNQLLEEDAAFKADFVFQQNVQRTIQQKERLKLKKHLQEIEKRERFWFSFKNNKMLPIAASLIVITLLSWLIFTLNKPIDTQKLYATYYAKYPNSYVPITRGTADSTTLYKAFDAYEKNNFDLSIQLLKEVKKLQATEEINFYLAQALIQENKTQEATVLLEGLVSKKSNLAPQSLWYLSLIYLKNNNIAKAKENLKTLERTGLYKKGEAQQLLKELE